MRDNNESYTILSYATVGFMFPIFRHIYVFIYEIYVYMYASIVIHACMFGMYFVCVCTVCQLSWS